MILVPTRHGFLAGALTALVDDDSTLKAWAERFVRSDPDLKWLLGNYVEADQANSNGHIFPLDELRNAQHTLAGKPLNMMHRAHYIVGAFHGAQLMAPDGTELADASLALGSDGHPYLEAVAGMWHTRFAEEFYSVRQAHADGSLFLSMEALPREVSCPSCGQRAAYAGYESDAYCTEMQGATGPKILHDPVFNGGAVIIPPVRPGWHGADVKAISQLMEQSASQAEAVYASVAVEAPHLGPREWEAAMTALLLQARKFSQSQRDKAADTGAAMPDKSFPIETVSDLRNAIRAVGRAKDPGAAKAHIKKRARALGREDLIPEGW